VFHGVCYEAIVKVNDAVVQSHRGAWDAFSVDVRAYAGQRVAIEVEVVKNGGSQYPVRSVLSGFLPFVFHTFGGIYREVELVQSDADPLAIDPVGRQRVSVSGGKIFVDGEPLWIRGVLHWGWYPELRHPNPPEELLRTEIEQIAKRGFNLVKFCLWLPPHRYIELLEEYGLFSWIELPLWDPSENPDHLNAMLEEVERIVRQYRRHSNVIAWTCGCELSEKTPFDFRKKLFGRVETLTQAVLVNDNSGSAEMYGGDLRSLATFEDFHPYCDLQFYAPVLDALLPGPRRVKPILLGECNDYDTYRDPHALARSRPFWASSDLRLNDQGVRRDHQLPQLLDQCTESSPNTENLVQSSNAKSTFVRNRVYELVRARGAFSGMVLTGLRDTPISTSGILDSYGSLKDNSCFPADPSLVAYLIPHRRPPWVHGGNRPGWRDSFNHFEGSVTIQLGLAADRPFKGVIQWELRKADSVVESGEVCLPIDALDSREIAELSWSLSPGEYAFHCITTAQAWDIWVVPLGKDSDAEWISGGPPDRDVPLRIGSLSTCKLADCSEEFAIWCLEGEGTVPMPFWRECAWQFCGESRFCETFAHQFERLLPISAEATLDESLLQQQVGESLDQLFVRIDTRTYQKSAYVSLFDFHGKRRLLTTLRPHGTHGCAPHDIRHNPAGLELIRALAESFPSQPRTDLKR